MDALAQSVASQTFTLNRWDLASSYTNIPYIYFFKNNGAADGASFMPAEAMRASFIKAVKEFPILLGHLVVAKDGSAYVHTDPCHLNMPAYRESSSSVHYSDIEEARFSWDSLPKGVATTSGLTAGEPGGAIRFAYAHVVRLRGDSGLVLFMSLSHYVVDGVGYCAFVNRWAEICRWMCAGAPPGRLPCRAYSFDRATFAHCLPGGSAGLSRDMRQIYASPNWAGRALAWMSPAMRAATLATVSGLVGTTGHIFHITHASIASLRESVLAHLDSGSHVSDNDIITALVSHTVATAMEGDDNASPFLRLLFSAARTVARMIAGMRDEFAIFMVLDIRSRVRALTRAQGAYTGNCVTCLPIVRPMGQFVAPATATSALAATCASVRAAVDKFDGPTVGALAAALDADTASFAHATVNGMRYPRKIVLSNQSRFTLYECDFGAGGPAWVSPLPKFYANFVSILPARPWADGYDIYMVLETDVMKRVVRSGLWTLHAKLVY
ncbi:hypothetical protein H4R21_003046 [Coemansia helicoidea]|uniref:Uncharacterized protein n=1 Tax=Coemansia helicoidea TaxID=1286919 RepID=A0ACC1L4T8_9FUNG|nr:hypothetical protein H4R21_003046 [Coemansia helicoidea]